MTEHRFDSDSIRFGDAPDVPLSASGAARRGQMLTGLQARMRGVHRMRRVRKASAAVIVPIALIAFGAWLWPNSAPSGTQTGSADIARGPSPENSGTTPSIPAAASRTMIATVVRTNAQSIESMIVRTSDDAAAAMTITDSELLTALAAIDRPTGLVRSGDRAWLTRSVADL